MRPPTLSSSSEPSLGEPMKSSAAAPPASVLMNWPFSSRPLPPAYSTHGWAQDTERILSVASVCFRQLEENDAILVLTYTNLQIGQIRFAYILGFCRLRLAQHDAWLYFPPDCKWHGHSNTAPAIFIDLAWPTYTPTPVCKTGGRHHLPAHPSTHLLGAAGSWTAGGWQRSQSPTPRRGAAPAATHMHANACMGRLTRKLASVPYTIQNRSPACISC